MAAVLQSPEDLANAVLARMGAKKRIGSFWNGSEESRRFLDIYGQTRDAVLRAFPWDFASKDASLGAPLKTAPVGGYTPAIPWTNANPPLPYIFEYAYPADMVQLRSLRDATLGLPNFDPRPSLWRIATDNVNGQPAKVILANLANAVATYTWQSTNPVNWEADFVEEMIDALLRRLAGADAETQKLLMGDEAGARQMAEMRQG